MHCEINNLAKNWKGGLSIEEHSRQKKWPAQGPQAVAYLLLLRVSKTSMAGSEEISSQKCGRELPGTKLRGFYIGIVWTPAVYTEWDGNWETN